MPIQVVLHLPDVFIVSRAKGPATLDERWALARMRWWRFCGVLGLSSGCLLLRAIAVAAVDEDGRVCLTRQVWQVVPWVGISEASQGDFVVIAAQCHMFRQCHPKVCHGVMRVQRLAGIAGQGEDHGTVESQCGTHHLETLRRRVAPAPPSGPGAAAPGREGTATDPDYVAFPGVETGRVTSPLNQVLCDVSPLARVQDGFHVKVVWRRDFLEFWAIESPLDWFTPGIGHNIGHRTGVSHGFHWRQVLLILTWSPDVSCSEPRPATRRGRRGEYRRSHTCSATPSSQRAAPCNGAVMCGVISAQQGRQNVRKTPGPVGHHVAPSRPPAQGHP